nr:restriction endonuclease subunit S [Lactobacillus crispatus]
MFDWAQRKLGDVTQRVQGNNNDMNLPILTISAKNGWMTQVKRFSNIIAGAEKKKYTLLKKGELSYNHGNSKLAPFGTVFMLDSYSEALVPKVYHSFKTGKDIEPYFVELYFHTKKVDFQLRKYISSSARMDGLLNITYNWFKQIKIFVPKMNEQNKLKKIFLILNKYISLQQRKLDQLKLVHKGLLHQLLKHNATWKEVKIKEILNVRNKQIFPNESYPLMSFVQNKGVIPKGKRYNRDFLVKGSKKYKMTEIGDFIYSSNNLETGSIGINKTGKAVISPVYSIFSSKNHDESQFIGLLAEDNAFIYKMLKYRQGVVYGQWKIPEKDFLNIQIKIPNLKTRERILALFTNLDNLFNQEKGKLNYLKRVKKFLLQNMFI